MDFEKALPFTVADADAEKEKLKADSRFQLAQNAVTQFDVKEVMTKRDVATALKDTTFSNKLPEMKATSQKASGRCWLFAALNVIRAAMKKEYNLADTFELSQSYLFFFDKLERANYFLNSIVETAAEELDSRLVQHLLSDPLCDGGQWDMIVNLVEKYGVVPKTVFPETVSSSASRNMNQLLMSFLRQYAHDLRSAITDGKADTKVKEMIGNMMSQVYRLLCVHLGTPPSSFSWNFADKDKKFFSFSNLTPQEFYKKHGHFDMNNYVSVIHDPRNAKNQMYSVKYLGNVVDGVRQNVRHLNVDISELRAYSKQQLEKESPVWFGCDAGKDFHRKIGAWDVNVFDYESVYGDRFKLSKEQRLRYGQSLMTHAMVFTGFHQPEGSEDIAKWRVENSWGTEPADGGYYTITDAWFDEYVYQIVVPREMLKEEHASVIDQQASFLEPWDPMGALAVSL